MMNKLWAWVTIAMTMRLLKHGDRLSPRGNQQIFTGNVSRKSMNVENNMIMICRLLLLFLLLPPMSALAEDFVAPLPDALVKQVVDDVISSIQQNREVLHDLRKMDDLVAARVLPHFDFPRMTRLMIGSKYWNDATPQDKQQLIDEFRIFLAHTFSDVIVQYTDQTIFFTPLHMQPEAKDVTVKTTVIDPHDEPTELDYRMENTPYGWIIYDINVDNISLVRIYRSNFSNELLQGGVPNLVSVLHRKNQEVVAARHDSGQTH